MSEWMKKKLYKIWINGDENEENSWNTWSLRSRYNGSNSC